MLWLLWQRAGPDRCPLWLGLLELGSPMPGSKYTSYDTHTTYEPNIFLPLPFLSSGDMLVPGSLS